MIVLVLLVNGVISFMNARAAGNVWAESKGIGGWIRILAWCAAIQSAVGFSYIYVTILVYIANAFNIVSNNGLYFMTSLAYVFLIVPLLGTGFIITIHSWIQAAREKSLLAMGIAGWNTFATAYNIYSAVHSFGAAFHMASDGIANVFSGDDDGDRDEDSMVLALAILALLAGIMTTKIIMNVYTGSLPVSAAVRKRHESC